MSERPIIFSAAMISALLAGRKTQTRRILKAEGPMKGADLTICPSAHISGDWIQFDHPLGGPFTCVSLPYAVGMQLWVREKHCIWGDEIYYAASDPGVTVGLGGFAKWRSPIFMPRSASRLTLTVSDVRVERLQDISKRDAIAEGIESREVECSDSVTRTLWFGVQQCGHEHGARGEGPIQAYADLWDSINNPRSLCAEDNPHSWTANPWACAISFVAERRNIGANRPPEPVSSGKGAL